MTVTFYIQQGTRGKMVFYLKDLETAKAFVMKYYKPLYDLLCKDEELTLDVSGCETGPLVTLDPCDCNDRCDTLQIDCKTCKQYL